jgi:hypothetical protein
MPDLVGLQQRYAGEGLQVVGIAVDEPAPVNAYLRQLVINYPILIGGRDAMSLVERAGNQSGGLPYTLIIERSGYAVKSYLGRVKLPELNAMLPGLLSVSTVEQRKP